MIDITAEHKAVADFLAEAEEISDQLGSELADLADMAESGDIKPDLLNSIFRGAHSLKGLAGMFGFKEIAELSHNMENLLDWLRLGKLNPDQHLIGVLSDSFDLMSTLIRTLSEGGSTSQHLPAISNCVAKINACLDLPDQVSTTSPLASLGLPDRVLESLTEYEEHRLLDNLAKGKKIYSVHTCFDLSTFDEELSRISEQLKTCGEIVSTLPSMSSNMETHIDFDLLFGTSATVAQLTELIGNDAISISTLGINSAAVSNVAVSTPVTTSVINLDKEEFDTVTPAVAHPENPQKDDSLSSKSMSGTVRVDIGKLDELMNIVGELVLAHSSIGGIAVRMRNEGFSRMAIDLGKAAKVLERKLTDLRKGVLEIRMIPVGQLYDKMSRIARKISREQGKKVELKFFGADTELDKLIVEDISDPMMHIIRNAVDHGIEMPETRLACGKEEKGTIRISSFQKGNHVIIEVEDDGAGIDIEKVKAKALQKNLIQDAAALTDREALELLFLPGFSTADKVSEISGRGVGMDVVKNNISAVSGMVDIESRKGGGSRFIITLPITLAIIKALIISCAGRTYAMPITSVLETLLINVSDIKTIERKEVIHLRESTLPLLRLDTFFRIEHPQQPQEQLYAVVVGAAEKRLGIVVDDLLGQQDIVIKSLGEAFKRFKGISGAADLGDQRTILVLDIGGMISESMKTGN